MVVEQHVLVGPWYADFDSVELQVLIGWLFFDVVALGPLTTAL